LVTSEFDHHSHPHHGSSKASMPPAQVMAL